MRSRDLSVPQDLPALERAICLSTLFVIFSILLVVPIFPYSGVYVHKAQTSNLLELLYAVIRFAKLAES